MINLEDAKVRVRVAVSEGVETCTEKNILRDALRDRSGKIVFGIAAAGDEEGPKANGKGTVGTRGSAMKLFSVGVAEDWDSYRILEDKRLGVVELVCGATQSHAECSSRWAGILHDERA